MRLYQGWHSAASWRVRWALAIKVCKSGDAEVI
jgi:hypothetical protein